MVTENANERILVCICINCVCIPAFMSVGDVQMHFVCATNAIRLENTALGHPSRLIDITLIAVHRHCNVIAHWLVVKFQSNMLHSPHLTKTTSLH